MFIAAFTIMRKRNSHPKCFSVWNSGLSNSCLWKSGICRVLMYAGQLETYIEDGELTEMGCKMVDRKCN